MKVKSNYALRQVADTWVVLPVGERVADFNGMISLNESGALIWKMLEQGRDFEKIVNTLMAEYGIDRPLATADAQLFIQKLEKGDLLETE